VEPSFAPVGWIGDMTHRLDVGLYVIALFYF